MPRRKDDTLLKSAFEEAFPDLLKFCFKEEADTYDIEKGFEFLDKELSQLCPDVEDKGGSRIVDMLVKVFLKDSNDWILVHVEIQSEVTKDFPKRMYAYNYRIYDRYDVDVVALAVFTGERTENMPNTFCMGRSGTKITYKYNTYHILDHSEEALLKMDNLFSLVVLSAQKALLRGKILEVELGEHRLTVARALLKSRKYSHEQIIRFLHFLKNFVYIKDPKVNRNFDQEIDLLTGKENAMGIIEAIKQVTREEALEEGLKRGLEQGREKGREEGREEGLEQGKTEFVKKLLLNTDFNMDKISMLAGVSESFINKVKKEVGQLSELE